MHTLLSHIDETGVDKVLVICPLSTVLNWVNEFRIWLKECAENKSIEIYEISKYAIQRSKSHFWFANRKLIFRYKLNRERVNKINEWHTDGGILIMGYDMFRNLSSDTGKLKKREKESIQASLVDPGPDLVVCDEGHLLKNSKTSLSKAVNRIRTLRRIVLTGTPLQNNLNECKWSSGAAWLGNVTDIWNGKFYFIFQTIAWCSSLNQIYWANIMSI